VAANPGFRLPGWGPFRRFVEASVVGLHGFLQERGVDEAYGWSIVIFTAGLKTLLIPVNFKQLESAEKVKALGPLQESIKEKFADDKAKQQQMLATLFAETQVNPLAGCLPAFVQIPFFIALYRSLLRLAGLDQLEEPFLWVPNLNGPQFGYEPGHTLDWLTQGWVDNVPPLGWHDTLLYLILPAVLFISQSVSMRILSPPTEDGDEAMERTQRILKFLPLIITWFAANAPAGLGIYWLTNNLFTTTQTIVIRKYFELNPVTFENVDMDSLANAAGSLKYDDYVSNRSKFLDEALVHPLPPRPRRRGAAPTMAMDSSSSASAPDMTVPVKSS